MNRFDIAEAHYVLESDYNVGGILTERPSNLRRNASTGWQLSRMHFRPSPNLSFSTLTDDGKEVYLTNVLAWNLPRDAELNVHLVSHCSPSWVAELNPSACQELFGQLMPA